MHKKCSFRFINFFFFEKCDDEGEEKFKKLENLMKKQKK